MQERNDVGIIMKASDTENILQDVISNLQNLVKVIELLEQKDDDSIFSLMKSNVLYDIEKLEKLEQQNS